MPNDWDRIMQLVLAAPERDERCRRAVCRRARRCVPPRDAAHEGLHFCPFGSQSAWLKRTEAVATIARRLIWRKRVDYAARGLPFPLDPPEPPDFLDFRKPLDAAALLALTTEPPAKKTQEKPLWEQG